MVLLALAAACLAAAGASPLPGDAVVLVQRALQSGQVASRWQNRLLDLTSSFKAGDHLEFRVAGSRWLNCTVLAEGQKPDTYTIRVPALPDGRRELEGVHASLLRDPRQEAARVAALRQAEQRAQEEERRRERQEALLFEETEDVLLMGRGKGAGKWFPARIIHTGQYPGTYDVRLIDNGMLIKSAEARFLKKTHDMHYETCETVDLRGSDGKFIRTKVLGPGSDVGTVNLQSPLSKNEVLKDIPVLALRKVRKAALRENTTSSANATTSANATSSANATNSANETTSANATSSANATNSSNATDSSVAGTNRTSAASDAAASGADEAAAAEPAVLLALGAEVFEAADANATTGGEANATTGGEANATTGGEANATTGSQEYEVGQPMWVQLGDDAEEVKPWVRGKILREGDFPGTYNLRVTAKIPSYDLCDVPVGRLQETEETIQAKAEEEARRKAQEEERQRAAEEEERLRAEEAAQKKAAQDQERELQERETRALAEQQAVIKVLSVAAYRPGQELQFNAQGSQWINCTVLSLAVKPHVYNIYVPSFPEELREISDVNGKALRSFEEAAQQEAERVEAPKRLAEEARTKAQKEHTFEPHERVQVQVKGTNTWADAVIKEKGSEPGWYLADVEGNAVKLHSSVLRRDPEHTFEEGEIVQIRSADNSAWVPCTVTRRGEAPNTYNIYFAAGPVGHRDMHNIDAKALRRIKFVSGQPVEVYMKRGPSKGMWVESEITGPVADKPDTYSVHVFDTPHEYNISQVAYKLIRRSEAHIARWREQLQLEAQRREDERVKNETEQREQLEWLGNHTFKDHEMVQVQTQVNGTGVDQWTNMVIASKGAIPNTYTLFWKDNILKNVRRDIIRKDAVRQAAKEKQDEESRRRVEEEEAQRKAILRARAKHSEEAQLEAEEKRRKMEEAVERGEAPENADEDIEIVPPETLASLVKEAEEAMAKEQEYQKKVIDRKPQKQQEKFPEDEDEDFAKRQAEWDEILKEVDSEAQEGEAVADDEASKQDSTPSAPKETEGKSGKKEEERPAEKPSEKPAEKPSEKTEEKAAEKPQEKAAEKSEEKAAEKPQEQPARKKKTFKELEAEKEKRKAQAKKAKEKRSRSQKARVEEATDEQETANTQVKEVKWSMDAETAKRQAEWDAMLAEDEQTAEAQAEQ